MGNSTWFCLDYVKDLCANSHTNVGSLDFTSVTGRSADVFVLESPYPSCIGFRRNIFDLVDVHVN